VVQAADTNATVFKACLRFIIIDAISGLCRFNQAPVYVTIRTRPATPQAASGNATQRAASQRVVSNAVEFEIQDAPLDTK
jgi:hypothetical protein